MEPDHTVTITAVDRLNECSLIVAFSDGRQGQFSAQMLYSAASTKDLFVESDVEAFDFGSPITVAE